MPRLKRTLVGLAVGAAIALLLVKCRTATPDAQPASPILGAAPHGVVVPLAPRAGHLAAVVAQGSIAGAIRDAAGAPIAGALVCAHGWSLSVPGVALRDPRCTTSDARGAYRIAPVPAASFEVAASAPTYRAAQWMRGDRLWLDVAAGEAHDGIDIVLARGGVEITGTVRDAGGGPLPRAHLRVTGDGMIALDTDDAGRYHAWVSPGYINVYAVADGYATAVRHGHAPGTLNLSLVPESAYGGTVVDAATGEPVADVRVTARLAAPNEHGTVEGETAITDEHGRFRIGRLEPGYYMALAQGAHGFGRSSATVELGLGRSVDDVVVKLYPGHQVTGRITLPDGSPCKDASVALRDDAHDRSAGAVQDLDGTLHVDGIQSGTYAVTVTCPEHVAQTYPPVVVADRDVTGLEWPVANGIVLSGRVTTSSGVPLANTNVLAEGVRTGPRDTPQVGAASTDEHGAFTLRGVPPGAYKVAAWSSRTSKSSPPVTIELGATPVQHDFVIDDVIGALAGRVTRADGSPVPAAMVTAVSESSSSVSADDSGHFLLDALTPGDYVVSVAVLGHPMPLARGAADPHVTVRADGTADVQLVVATGTRELRGWVIDAHNAPITDARIVVGRELGGEAHALDDSLSVLVAADGSYVVTGLDDGEYTIRATRPNGTVAVAKHVTAGSVASLLMPTGGAIVGTARSTTPIDDLDITLTEGANNNNTREEHLYHASAFAFRDLAAGHYTLAFVASNRQRVVDVVLAEGETVTLDVDVLPTITVVGRVVHATTGAPLAGVSMHATIHDATYTPDTPDLANVSDDTGRFTIHRVPRGPLMITGQMRIDDSTSTLAGTIERDASTASGVLDVGDFAATPP